MSNNPSPELDVVDEWVGETTADDAPELSDELADRLSRGSASGGISRAPGPDLALVVSES